MFDVKHQVNVYSIIRDSMHSRVPSGAFRKQHGFISVALQGYMLPAHRFAPYGATMIFFYRVKKENHGQKKTPAPDTMLSPAPLLLSLKRVVGFA